MNPYGWRIKLAWLQIFLTRAFISGPFYLLKTEIMEPESHHADIDKKYCCEELRLVVELDDENQSLNDEESNGIPEALFDLRNLKRCPFCGADR